MNKRIPQQMKIACIKTRSFDMPQRTQDIFTVAAALMDIMFLFGIIRVL